MRKLRSPNTFFVRFTADKMLKKTNGAGIRIYDLVAEVQKKYKFPVRYDITVNYLIGGPYWIDCKNHIIHQLD